MQPDRRIQTRMPIIDYYSMSCLPAEDSTRNGASMVDAGKVLAAWPAALIGS
jgi:hypothetical protein